MKDGPRNSDASGREPDREALRRRVRHPYITRQEPRRQADDEDRGEGEEGRSTPAT